MAMPRVEDLPVPPKDLAKYISANPSLPLNKLLEPYRKYEAELRATFAQDRDNPALNEPYLNVLPLFTEHTQLITTRARDLEAETPEEKERYIMALTPETRRKHGSPAVVPTLKEFQKNFNIFSESSLVDMNWDNVVAAGSSAVNCLLPVPPEFCTTKRKLREYYHEKFCPASDVDLFLYGLTHDQAIEKIKEIERSIRDAILTEVTVVRTKYAITIASQYPVRHVQIVLRVYKSIGEILTGFDIDAAGAAYDGKQVWVAPRALGSFITQVNQIDLSRRSPSYENRLSKYSKRGFEVHWPELDRSRVDPTIFERSFQRTLGLARLLVLERLPTSSSRETYTNKRREERGRPALYRNPYHRLGGNIKDSHEDEVADWVDESEVSNYHTFTVPYGPKFNSRKVEKLCYSRDLLLNSEWNQPKEREVYLHRHPAFFGRVEDVIEDCCGACPKPETEEEREIAEKEAEIYISGKVSFLIDNPGRQQIGSFNPLTENDWTDMAYIGNTARLCQSIVDGDVDEVLDWLSQDGSDPNNRDYTGRSPLHLAVMSSTPEVVRCLVDHGARITARLADGRTALHLAAERGQPDMIKILMEKSVENEEKAEEQQARLKIAKFGRNVDSGKPAKGEAKESVDEDDDGKSNEESSDAENDSDIEIIPDEDTEAERVSIATGSFIKVKKEEEEEGGDGVVPDEPADDPDYYKIDVLSWDIPCSPMHLAIAAGHEEAVTMLCEYGSDALLPVKFLNTDKEPTNAILTLALALSLPLEKAKSMAKLLLKLGASAAQADLHGCTAFHRYVENADSEMVDVLWDLDKTGVRTALNFLVMQSSYWNPQAIAPLHTAITHGDSVLVLRLLSVGANVQIDFESMLKAAKFSKQFENRLGTYEANMTLYHQTVEQPLTLALRTCPDPEVAYQLVEGGADPNAMTQMSYKLLKETWMRNNNRGETALDSVRAQLEQLRKYMATREKFETKKPELPVGMDEYLEKVEPGTYEHWIVSRDIESRRAQHEVNVEKYEKELKEFEALKGVAEKRSVIAEIIVQFERLEQLIVEKGGKTFEELHPDIKSNVDSVNQQRNAAVVEAKDNKYSFSIEIHQTKDVTASRKKAYIELFEAAWAGKIDKIKLLTTQSWDEDASEVPLKIAVLDSKNNSPFSLAFLRGHHDVAAAILEIAKAQYAPEEKEAKRFTVRNANSDEDEDYDEEEQSEDEDESEPRIVAVTIDKKFTIENIGQVSTQVRSQTRPLTMLLWNVCTFKIVDGKLVTDVNPQTRSLFRAAMEMDDQNALKDLLKMAVHHASQRLDGDEDEPTGHFAFPDDDFLWAVANGKTQALGEIIKTTGAGIPLDHLVKKSGVQVKEKPRFYQGLTVYGRKRKDWANKGREMVVKSTGTRTPPLLHAAVGGSIESVEWFLGDAPHRHYVEFGKSKAAQADSRLKQLNQAAGGFDRSVARWLGLQNDLILHCAVISAPNAETTKLVKYVVKTFPNALEVKNSAGDTPLMTAAWLGRTSFVKILIDAGADQSVRNKAGQNLIHYALQGSPPAERLRGFLQLLDPDLLPHLFQTRSNLREEGTTPLHAFVQAVAITRSTWYYNYSNGYKKDEDWLAVLAILLEFSGGAELEMLNGAGDTPLHTAVMRASPSLVRALLAFRPKLLYRENAVGRTPAEVARDLVTADKFSAPSVVSLPREHGNSFGKGAAGNLVTRRPEDFAGKNPQECIKTNMSVKNTPSNKFAVWAVIEEVMLQNPDKRRLVSLNEANDVARRLGEKYTASRYFSIQARDDDEVEKDDEDDEKDAKNKDDFSVGERKGKWSWQWICENCQKRH